MAYTPITSVQPKHGNDKLKELLDFLQSDINNSMKMEEFKNKQTATKQDSDYRMALLQNPQNFGFTNVTNQETGDYANLPTSDLLSTLSRVNSAKALQTKAQVEAEADAGYNNLITDEAKNPSNSLSTLIDKARGYNVDPKSVMYIWNERQQIAAQNKAASKTDKERLVSETQGVNTKNAYRTQGLETDGYVVKISGTDTNPQSNIYIGKVKYSKRGNNYYKMIGGKYIPIDGMEDNIDKIKESLDNGIKNFQGADIDAKGRDTSTPTNKFENRFKK